MLIVFSFFTCHSYSSGALDSFNTFTADDESVVHRSAQYIIAEAFQPLRFVCDFIMSG